MSPHHPPLLTSEVEQNTHDLLLHNGPTEDNVPASVYLWFRGTAREPVKLCLCSDTKLGLGLLCGVDTGHIMIYHLPTIGKVVTKLKLSLPCSLR